MVLAGEKKTEVDGKHIEAGILELSKQIQLMVVKN